ncbi:hypothetical protein FQA47_021778 [Oryzias melastigma]|uniref:Uncharacterized protein n=1 Tax=Oryzias melastigma TaxID=30732 RepID=A0A834C7S4_ORYME|nr:hypothetical protein FQA47_021778 [Oryzias melastigma]
MCCPPHQSRSRGSEEQISRVQLLCTHRCCTAVKENGAQLHQQEENFFIHCARLLVPVAAAGSSFTASLMAGVQQLPVYHKRFLRL